jgi:hypothetical protein
MMAACLQPVAGVVLPAQVQGMFASAEISAPAKSISAIHRKTEMRLDDLHPRSANSEPGAPRLQSAGVRPIENNTIGALV